MPTMARGPKKHLKRLRAPKHWMLDKLTGIFAPRPSTGPHSMRESLLVESDRRCICSAKETLFCSIMNTSR